MYFNLSKPKRYNLYSPEDHGAVLPVKGKVVDSDGTSTAVDCRRQPVHTAVWRHQGIAVKCYFKLSIHTASERKEEKDEKKGLSLTCLMSYTPHSFLTEHM